MDDIIYEKDGKRISRKRLEEKFGDKTDEFISKLGFTQVEQEPEQKIKKEVEEPKSASERLMPTEYYKDGKNVSRMRLVQKFGDKTDEMIEKHGFQPVNQEQEFDNKGDVPAEKEKNVSAAKKENSDSESPLSVSESNSYGEEQESSSVTSFNKEEMEKVKREKEENAVSSSEDLLNRLKSGAASTLSGVAGIKNMTNKAALSVIGAFNPEFSEKLNSLTPKQREIFLGTVGIMAGDAGMSFASSEIQEELKVASEKYKERTIEIEGTITDAIGEGRLGDAGYKTAQSITESLPFMALAFVPGGLGVIGAGTASNKMEDLEDEGEKIELNTVLNATVNGVAEAYFEKYTKQIGLSSWRALKGAPKKEALEYADGIVKFIMKDAGIEGLSEAATSATQQLSDGIIQGRDMNFLDFTKNVTDALIVGGVMGGGMSTLKLKGYVAGKSILKERKKAIDEKSLEIQALEEQTLLPDVPDGLKKVLKGQIGKLQKEVTDLEKKEIKRAEQLTDDEVVDLFKTNNEIDEVINEGREISEDESVDKGVKETALNILDKKYSELQAKKIKYGKTKFEQLPDKIKESYREKAKDNLVEKSKSDSEIVEKSAESLFVSAEGKKLQKESDLKEKNKQEAQEKTKEQESEQGNEQGSNKGKVTIFEDEQVDNEFSEDETTEEVSKETTEDENLDEYEQEVLRGDETITEESSAEKSTPKDTSGKVAEDAKITKETGEVTEEKQAKPTEQKVVAEEVYEPETYLTKNKMYTVKKGVDGLLDVFTSKGRKIKKLGSGARNKWIKEFVSKTNFNKGKKAIDENSAIPDNADVAQIVADKSANPKEVAETLTDGNFDVELDPKTEAIANAVKGGVKKKSFDAAVGKQGEGVSSSFFSKKGDGLDVIAMNVETELYGEYNANEPRVTEQEVADFMLENKGSNDYLNQSSEVKSELNQKFEQLTGLKSTPSNIEAVAGREASKAPVTPAKIDETIDDEIPFQQTSERLTPVSEKVFIKLVNKLKKAFPKTNIIVDKALVAEKLKEVKNSQLIKDSEGTVYGFVAKDGTVYMNLDKINANTPVHEFGHIWLNAIEKNNSSLFKKGMKLIMGAEGKPYMDKVNSNPAYAKLNKAQRAKEALVTAMGDKGQAITEAEAKSKFRAFMRNVKNYLKRSFFQETENEISSLSFEQFLEGSVSDMLGGKNLDADAIQDSNIVTQLQSEQSKENLDEQVFGREADFDMLRKAEKSLESMKDKYFSAKESYKVKKDRISTIKNELVKSLDSYINQSGVDLIYGEVKRISSAVANADTPKQLESALEKFGKVAFDAKKRAFKKSMQAATSKHTAKEAQQDAKIQKQRQYDITKALLAQAKTYLGIQGVKENITSAQFIQISRIIASADTDAKMNEGIEKFGKIVQNAKRNYISKQMNLQNKKMKRQEFIAAKEKLQSEIDSFEKDYFKNKLNNKNVRNIRKAEVQSIVRQLSKKNLTETEIKKSIKRLNNIFYDLESRRSMATISKLLNSKLTKVEAGRRKPNLTDEQTAKTITGVKQILNEFAVNRHKQENKKTVDAEFIDTLKKSAHELVAQGNLNDKEQGQLSSILLATSILDSKVAETSKEKLELLLEAQENLTSLYSEGVDNHKAWVEQRRAKLDGEIKALSGAANRTGVIPSESVSQMDAAAKSWRNSMFATTYDMAQGKGMGDLQGTFRVIDKAENENIHGGVWNDLYRKIIRADTNKTFELRRRSEILLNKQREIFGDKNVKIRGKKRLSEYNMNTTLGKIHKLAVTNKVIGKDADGNTVKDSYEASFTESQLLNLIMHSQNPELKSSFDFSGYDSDFLEQAEKLIDPKTKEYGEYLFEFYDDYYSSVNDVYKEMYGHSLGRPTKYAGKLGREGYTEDETQDFMDVFGATRTAAAKSTKERTDNVVAIEAQDVNASAAKYMYEMEHFKSYAKVHRTFDSLLKNNDFKKVLAANNKGEMNGLLMQRLKYYRDAEMVRGGINAQGSKFVEYMMSQMVKSTLAIKPKIAFNQMLSMTNTVPFLPKGKNAFKAYANPQQWTKDAVMLFKSSTYIKNRWDGKNIASVVSGLNTVTATGALSGGKNGKTKAGLKQAMRGYDEIQRILMLNIKIGDMAGVMGSVPVYTGWKAQYVSEGATPEVAHEKALTMFEASVEQAQQGQTNYAKSEFQKSPIGKFFTMFVTAPLQNYRNTFTSLVELNRARKGKAFKGTVTRNLTSIANFGFLQPLLYTWIAGRGVGGLAWLLADGDDEEEDVSEADKSMLSALILGNMGTLPIAGGALTLLVDVVLFGQIEKIGSKGYTFGGILNTPIVDEGAKIKLATERYQKATSLEDKEKYMFKAANGLNKLLLGMPVEQVKEYYEIIENKDDEWTNYDNMERIWLLMGHKRKSLQFDK